MGGLRLFRGPDFPGALEPLHFIVNRLLIGSGLIPQFLLCLAVVKSVVSCQIIDGEGGHHRLLPLRTLFPEDW